MKTMSITTILAALAILATGMFATPLLAQDKAVRAAALESEADALVSEKGEFERAAELYRKAGHLRLEGDPQGVQDLLRAGALAFYLGDHAQASDDLARAAEIAWSFGDVRTAARAYLDAATAAARSGRDTRAYDLAVRAQRLAQSPLLELRERSTLLRRIDQGVGQ